MTLPLDNLNSPIKGPHDRNGYRSDGSEPSRRKDIQPQSSKPFEQVFERAGEREDSKTKKKKGRPNIEGDPNLESNEILVNEEDSLKDPHKIYAAQQSGERDPRDEQSLTGQLKSETNALASTERKQIPPPFMNLPPPPAKEASKDSPFALYKEVHVKERGRPFALDADNDQALAKASDKSTTKKADSKYQQEQFDLDKVNPLAASQSDIHAIADAFGDIPQAAAPTHIKDIVAQIVKEMHIIEQSGKTDTIIILNRPDVFNNARVVVTSFDSATKEFNLSFENLTAQAKQLLDMNLYSLRNTLEENGYANAIHIMTTTTLIEHALPGEQSQYARGDEEDKQNRGQQRQKQQSEEETA